MSDQSDQQAKRSFLYVVLCACGIDGDVGKLITVDLVNTMDPQLVAAAFGMDPQAAVIYLADHVDAGRLPAP